jgi:hypothetical protein
MDEEDQIEATVIDLRREGFLLPPAPDRCQQCAADHEPLEPHDQRSLYYRVWFERQRGRAPTWDDAMAHCPPEVQAAWKEMLAELGLIQAEE